VIPGGVNSPVRAFRAVGGTPLFIARGAGAEVFDADGRAYLDLVGSWGPLIAGHAHPAVLAAVRDALGRGMTYGAPCAGEVELAERVVSWYPAAEQLRFVSSGTEAVMSAIRVARAFTGRDLIVKFAGCYHGHADPFLIRAGSGAATFGVPDSPGVTPGAARDTHVARYNDLDDVDRCFRENPDTIAAVIVEPVAGNMGCVPPAPGFLAGLRARCDRHGALLILDEVITGFRLGPGGASARYGVTGDLVILGKVLGGGMPLAAFGGKRAAMERVSPAGPVYQAGTYAAHPLSIAAGLAVLDALDADPGLDARLESAGERVASGFESAARETKTPLAFQRVGSMWTPFFSAAPVRSWDDAASADTRRHAAFFRAMLERGFLLPPSQFECAFLSAAHGASEIEGLIGAARESLAEAAA
jgi:glutamate-1-semialdehyde 2,1-aminomutase